MARPLRLQVENGVYHVYSRGRRKEQIFRDDRDALRFLRALREARDRCGWSILSYCLMVNHYHLVIRTPVPNLSGGMRHLNGTYAQAFNSRSELPGSVFQGRFGSRLIQRDEHLLATLGYVAVNPVKAGLCHRPEEWRWSAHRAIVGLSGSRLVDVGATLGLLADERAVALSAYAAAVHRADGRAPNARGGIVVGDASFAASVMRDAPPASSEIPQRQRLAGRPDLATLLARGPEGLGEAYFTHAYTLREIAPLLGCHYSTVSRRLARLAVQQERPDPV